MVLQEGNLCLVVFQSVPFVPPPYLLRTKSLSLVAPFSVSVYHLWTTENPVDLILKVEITTPCDPGSGRISLLDPVGYHLLLFFSHSVVITVSSLLHLLLPPLRTDDSVGSHWFYGCLSVARDSRRGGEGKKGWELESDAKHSPTDKT